MKSRWIKNSSEIDINQKWFPKTGITDRTLKFASRFPTLVTETEDGTQIALVQGFIQQDMPSTWLVHTSYFADGSRNLRRLWLRNSRFHEEWIRCCKEISITACVIKFRKGSSIEKAYGKNIVSKLNHIYTDVHWFEPDKTTSLLRFTVPL